MTRRFLLSAIAGAVAGELWVPGKKLISIPKSVRPPQWRDIRVSAIRWVFPHLGSNAVDAALRHLLSQVDHEARKAMREPEFAPNELCMDGPGDRLYHFKARSYYDLHLHAHVVTVSTRVRL
jgi:hypothetical protein